MKPDDIVENSGRAITLTRVSDYSAGPEGAESVEREFEQTKGVVSSPSEEQLQNLEGRLDEGAITVTLFSNTDIEPDRDGGRDRLILGHVDPSTAEGTGGV